MASSILNEYGVDMSLDVSRFAEVRVAHHMRTAQTRLKSMEGLRRSCHSASAVSTNAATSAWSRIPSGAFMSAHAQPGTTAGP